MKWSTMIIRAVLDFRNILPFSQLRTCRFSPSCSSYAEQALKYHGLLGIGLIVWRLVRCQPFGQPGFDPVK